MTKNVKSWLNRANKLDRDINNLCKQKEAIKEKALSITQSYSGDVAQVSKDPHKYDRLVEINSDIDDLIDQLADVRKEILAVINQVDNTLYRVILMDRYITGWTWERIAVEINYSYPQTVRLHGYALSAVKQYIPKDDIE